jgi:TetR/AcrR family transcriptional regulator, tetracycline repressor protein
MPGRRELELSRAEIVRAALEIFESDGLPAVSMRTVAARLGVSPVPVYRRVGNKDALLDAMAYHLLEDVVPPLRPDVDWREYAIEWATALRDRLGGTSDTSLLIGGRRAAYVEASKPLVAALQSGGFEEDAAVQACRLLIWAVAGFVAVETRRGDVPPRKETRSRPGSDPHGISPAEADELFRLHLQLLVGGLEPEPARAKQRGSRPRATSRPPARRG